MFPASGVNSLDDLYDAVAAALGAHVPHQEPGRQCAQGRGEDPFPFRSLEEDPVQAAIPLVERAVEGGEQQERIVEHQPERSRHPDGPQSLRLQQGDANPTALAQLLDAKCGGEDQHRRGEKLEMPMRLEKLLFE